MIPPTLPVRSTSVPPINEVAQPGEITTRLVCIIIPVHNRMLMTLSCLDRLRWCSRDPEWKIILVDDGSTDGTGEVVRTFHPHVEIVQGTGDLFWTGAMRAGMQRAMKLGCTEIIWLNDDTDPDETSLRRIAELVQEDPQQMIASTALVRGRAQASCSLGQVKFRPVAGRLHPADVLAGFQVAFSSEVVRRIGLPDAKKWPHYGGDSGFTRTAHNAGFQLFADGDSVIRLCDPPPQTTLGEIFWRGEESLAARIRRVFFSVRSPYRLSTAWHLDTLYRGLVHGTGVFSGRLLVAIGKILTYRKPRTQRQSRS